MPTPDRSFVEALHSPRPTYSFEFFPPKDDAGEELLWRGFLFDRLNRLAGIKGRIWLALLIQAAAFGLPHIYQGMGGVLITGVVGLFLGWVRIKSSWSLLPCVLAHAAVDTVMMSLAYAQKLEWIAF